MLKLYVWNGPQVLRHYAPGIAFALADSSHAARRALKEELTKAGVWEWQDWVIEQGDDQPLAQERRAWIEDEPKEFDDVPVCFFLQGSE